VCHQVGEERVGDQELDAAAAGGGAGDVSDLVAPAERPELVAALAGGF
jgi:hypothetical protein